MTQPTPIDLDAARLRHRLAAAYVLLLVSSPSFSAAATAAVAASSPAGRVADVRIHIALVSVWRLSY